MFTIEKCRLRCENKTRWSSAYLTLYSVYRAYKRELNMKECPLKLSQIEFYLQILLPAYKFSIGFQRTKSNIGEVVPSILILFNTWTKLAENTNFKSICEKFIKCFKKHFDYELKSNVYFVAALLNTSKLNIWYWKNYAEDIAFKAKEELINVAFSLLDNLNALNNKSNNSSVRNTQKSTQNDDDDMFYKLHCEEEENEEELNTTTIITLRKEKEIFLSLIHSDETSALTTPLRRFWIENKKQLPNLFKLANQLLSIPSSSAFVERFFSICGVICKKRCGNMSDETFIMRSFIKCNLAILNGLKR